MSIRALVSGMNLFTPCLTEKTFEELEYLTTRIIRESEKHFSSSGVQKIILAMRRSAQWHEGMRRSEEGKPPYIVHPFRGVVALMARGIYDFKLIIAMILHDAFEDAKTKERRYRYRKTVLHEFRSTVYGVIELVTKGSQQWEKALFFKILLDEKRTEISWRAKLLKLMDCLDNAQSFDVFEVRKRREKIAEVLREYPRVAESLSLDVRKLIRKGRLPAYPYENIAENVMREIRDALYHHAK